MNVKMAVILPLPQYVKQALCVSVYQAMKHKYQHTLVLFYLLHVSTGCVCHKHLCVFIFQSLEPFRYVHNRMQQSGEIRTHPLQRRHMGTIVFQNPGSCLWNSFRRTKILRICSTGSLWRESDHWWIALVKALPWDEACMVSKLRTIVWAMFLAECYQLGPLLIIWINFDHSMDE